MADIKPQHLEIIMEILDRNVPDYEVWVFGSRVNGQVKKYSDLDLVFIGSEQLSINRLSKIEEAFRESDLPYRVDLVDWSRISEEFRTVIRKKYEVLRSLRGGI